MKKLFASMSAIMAFLILAPVASAVTSTEIILSSDMATSIDDVIDEPTSWFFYNDETNAIDNALGLFVMGPDTAPEGEGSVQISVSGTQRRNLATYQFSGTPLASITTLAFSTYNPSAGNGGSLSRSGYLNFNVDFNASDTWQRRLVFVPSDNGTIIQNTWQQWDAFNSGNALWRYSGATWPGTATSGTTTRTWNDILTSYPGVRMRVTDSWLGVRIGEPYADGYTENIDAFKFGIGDNMTIFDFEPTITVTNKNDCKKGGWSIFNSPAFKNQGDCVSYYEKSIKEPKYIETLEVAANSSTPISSSKSLAFGKKYLLKVSGTAFAGDGIEFDADYSFRTPSSISWTDDVSTYESVVGLLDLQVNGLSVNWGSYTNTHEYGYVLIGSGAPVDFMIYDTFPSNNTGSLSVTIKELN